MTPFSSFSRPRTSGLATVELRGDCPRVTVEVLDAICRAQDKNRTELVNEILNAWAKQKLVEASLIARVTRGNPDAAEFLGELA